MCAGRGSCSARTHVHALGRSSSKDRRAAAAHRRGGTCDPLFHGVQAASRCSNKGTRARGQRGEEEVASRDRRWPSHRAPLGGQMWEAGRPKVVLEKNKQIVGKTRGGLVLPPGSSGSKLRYNDAHACFGFHSFSKQMRKADIFCLRAHVHAGVSFKGSR